MQITGRIPGERLAGNPSAVYRNRRPAGKIPNVKLFISVIAQHQASIHRLRFIIRTLGIVTMGGTSKFDAYHKWLGIPPSERPVNHYRLLGLALFEDDVDLIAPDADHG